MVKNLNDKITDSEEFREKNRGIMEGQYELDFYTKSLSNHFKSYENDTPNQKLEFWLLIVPRGGAIPENVNIYHMAQSRRS